MMSGQLNIQNSRTFIFYVTLPFQIIYFLVIETRGRHIEQEEKREGWDECAQEVEGKRVQNVCGRAG